MICQKQSIERIFLAKLAIETTDRKAYPLLDADMSVSRPSDCFPVRGKTGSTMRLPLHTTGDHNGNAFPISSSSSSSSSSCLGESSPESLRSLSSLSGSCIDSPLDYDMFEVTLVTTVMATTDEMTGVVVSKWVPEEEMEEEDGKVDNNDEVSAGKMLTAGEVTESNDNSVSVYLDANGGESCNDTWNENLTMALTLTMKSGSESSEKRRHGSSTPDSDATEIPADDDDEEEGLFLSVSSDVGMRRASTTLTSLAAGLQTEGTEEERSGVESDEPVMVSPLNTEPPVSEDLNEAPQISSPSGSPAVVNEVASPPPEEEAERPEVSPKKPQPNTRAAKTKSTNTTPNALKTATSTAVTRSSQEVKRVSKPDLKNVKAKVGSRSNASPVKTPVKQNSPAPANVKRVASRRDEIQKEEGDKKQRSPAGPVRAAVVLRPVKGKSSNLKTNHRPASSDSTQPDKKSLSVSRKLSASTNSLGSEDGPRESPRRDVQIVSNDQEKTNRVEMKNQGEDAHEESAEDQRETSGKCGPEKQRNNVKKVSSKLGPNARQQGSKGTPGLAPAPPGTGTGPPGSRQNQSEGSTVKEGGQNGGGSPTRRRPSHSQSPGLPKPRTTAERASTAASSGPPTPSSKPSAGQQPVSGGRPTPPTATSASKLPVKGLTTSLSSSSLGSNENNGGTKGAPGPAAPKPEERPSRNAVPAGGQNTAKTHLSSSPSSPSEALPSVSSGVTAAPKPAAIRSRALSLQARALATGLKAPSVTNHITAKTSSANQTPVKTLPAASQLLAKQPSQNPLQRSGSARLSRLNSTVDKNKPREAPARPTNTSSGSQGAAGAVTAAGNNQNQQQPPPDLVPDVVNANRPNTPVPAAETTTTGSGTTGASTPGFKARTGSRSSPRTGPRLQNASKPVTASAPAAVADGTVQTKPSQSKEQVEKKNSHLKKLLVQGNKKVEALATVIQHLFSEREESLRQKKELSLELTKLRDELVASSQCCKHLQKEKEEVRANLEEALKTLEEKHKEELAQLEDRLRSFYQTEWDKVHQQYQEEADKCRMLMEQQVEELRNRQEAERKSQEESHNQKLQSLKVEYEASVEELKKTQQTDLENLQKTLKETEASLSEKVSELLAEREALTEKLNAEEERRQNILSDKNLKDSHTVFLEQELESLKVVLDMKNNQLHQKDKKLMEMDKLIETNVKLQECLNKVQQENEDYKARMDRHAALSKQLSTEQAILQQTLQKESKVNKRLSMENEELLWKLHNGDLLASPSRRLSPTSPFSSPRNSASFPTAAPISPR
ncbi:microtubule-associated tumor suppressor 1 homolog [Cheilinus undulatus]|uniref:microtubule-associated tumor suppressor 1 homolog n=1 Tax=Cheilinus undulatus TaxID=241271 RepID=UPI001BD4E637|nr:microtubule-associated tumor suppressor 1 homolog [Cheilinus undulatus]XP_041641962.1 microtubule-associated tumor suppressor 1 homolog [Cheilinus undulatus]XP_041641963.1 microtubule-associated tumor suppressor 1 homolog [Cheilinus undulatus]